MQNNLIKPAEAAKRLGVTVKTLQRWDASGKLKAHRSPTNRRYYTTDQINQLTQSTPDNPTTPKTIVYARVSSHNQKNDLQSQTHHLQQYARKNNIPINDTYTDIGSGLNYNRPNWNKLLKQVMNSEVNKIIITHKDRFVRFGYDWFNKLAQDNNCEIIITDESEDMTPEAELVQDLISIIHVFSCKAYGLRRYEKAIKEDPNVESIQN